MYICETTIYTALLYLSKHENLTLDFLHLLLFSFLFFFLYFRCDAEHFLDELGLSKIPVGDWFCNICVEKKSVAPQSAKKIPKVSVKTAAKSISTPQKKGEKASVEIDMGVSRKRGTEAVISSPAPEGRRSARLH